MTSVTVYHNPRCSKSRQTLALLEAQDISVTVIPYLTSPPDENTLKSIISSLGVSPMDIVRRGEDGFKTSGLNDESTEDQVIQAIIAAPKLLQRPIVVRGDQARIGRPPETVLELL